MKLTIEHLTHFTPQDTVDLAKIWPNTDITALSERLSGSFSVFAARFNDRLLASIQVIIDNEWNEARLVAPLVREVTRRRGVGLYLINETERLMPEINHWWLGNNQPLGDVDIMDKFMVACGFYQEVDGWHKRR